MDRGVLIPDPLQSDKQYAKFHHLDIPDMKIEKLEAEFYYLQAHIYRLSNDAYIWVRQRVTNLQAELRKRRGVRL